MNRHLLRLLLLGLTLAPVQAWAQAESVIWPLDLPTRYLTSNFMEYRPGRFHAGLDLKTQTVNGFAARAVEDGWILRVRATPTAYGRAVYLRGKSGRTYVYAHLSRFNDQLRGLVDAQRAKTGTYRARLQFAANAVQVKQGDILGLTGESGTGGPHLHFEVRDRRNRPIEPQSLGFAVNDTMAPVIHHLRVWPATAVATIQGVHGEHILAADGGGLSGDLAALQVTGPVAFSARIIDQSDIRGHRLEPSLLEVYLDGEKVYHCRNEYYDFAENALQRLEWVVLPGVKERWLHRMDGNTLTGRQGWLWHLGPDGQGLTPGTHEIRLVAADQAGNTTQLHFRLMVAEKTADVPISYGPAWRLAEVGPVVVASDSTASFRLNPFYEREAPVGVRRRDYSPAAGDPVLADMSVYSREVGLDDTQKLAAANQGLLWLGVAREFVAANWWLEAALPVVMPDPAPANTAERQTWHLYRWTGDDWNRAQDWPQTVAKESMVTTHLSRPGLYAVLADHSPPVIGRPTEPVVIRPGPVSTHIGVTLPYWEVLALNMADFGSGLAPESIKVQLDGVVLIVEPDLPRDQILVEFPAEMTPGGHQLVIEVADEVGQMARRELEIQASE